MILLHLLEVAAPAAAASTALRYGVTKAVRHHRAKPVERKEQDDPIWWLSDETGINHTIALARQFYLDGKIKAWELDVLIGAIIHLEADVKLCPPELIEMVTPKVRGPVFSSAMVMTETLASAARMASGFASAARDKHAAEMQSVFPSKNYRQAELEEAERAKEMWSGIVACPHCHLYHDRTVSCEQFKRKVKPGGTVGLHGPWG